MLKYIRFTLSTVIGAAVIMLGMCLRQAIEALWANGGQAFGPAFEGTLNRYLTVGNIIVVLLEAAAIYGVIKVVQSIGKRRTKP